MVVEEVKKNFLSVEKMNELFYDSQLKQVNFKKMIQYLDYSYQGIIISNREGRVLYANNALERISGFKIDEVLGLTTEEMKEKKILINNSVKVLKKEPLTMVQTLSTGKEVFITSQPIIDGNGKIIYYIANYHDLNEINDFRQEHQNVKEIDYLELEELRSKFLKTDKFISRNLKMRQIIEKTIKVAKTDATVLIRGESGTGKELIAKTIHKASKCANKAFIQINCAAIPETLMEAELFGYEKGAFTGATKNKIGLLEMANGGIVLLDEIGDMPLLLQAKLLRVIQSKEFYPVGANLPKAVNIRVLAATHRDLETMVKDGLFREDLFYRLNVIPIEIPALRDRREDIVPFACHFLEKFNEKYGYRKRFDSETLKVIEKYCWPGNIRELENFVERMVIIADEDTIKTNLLPDEMDINSFNNQTNACFNNEELTLNKAKELLEKEMILTALKKSRSIREAARFLGIHHSNLLKKIEKHQIVKRSGVI